MTKFEWEKELKHNLKKIPQDELDRVLDFYNESFYDKIEGGLSEKEAVRSFGNPFDVAYKIVYDLKGVPSMAESTQGSPTFGTHASTEEPQNGINQMHTIDKTEVLAQQNASALDSFNTQQPPIKNPKRTGCVVRLIFFVPFLIIAITLWSLVISLAAAGIGATLGGIAGLFIAFTTFGSSAAIGLTNMGMALAATGAGLLLCALTYAVAKISVRLTQKYFFMGKHKAAAIALSKENQ